MEQIALDELASRAEGGDRDALGDLIDHLSPDLYGYLADLVRDRALAEDLLQRFWLQAMSQMRRRRAPVRPWAFRVARHLAFDALRARRRRRESRLDECMASDRVVTEEQEPAALMESEDEGARLRHRVACLRDAYREVVLLRFYSGMTLKEMAQVLECPVGTVATRLRRALAQLREEMQRESTSSTGPREAASFR